MKLTEEEKGQLRWELEELVEGYKLKVKLIKMENKRNHYEDDWYAEERIEGEKDAIKILKSILNKLEKE